MSEKYIIEYIGGCRGDFLCNFLNFNNLLFTNKETSQSNSNFTELKKLTKKSFVTKSSPTAQELKDVLQKIECKYTPSHAMFYFNKNLYDIIEKFQIKILKINFSKVYYKNVWIENIFKSDTTDLQTLYEFNEFSDEEKNNYILQRLNYKIPSYSTYFNLFNNKQNENKIILNYHELFFDINLKKYFHFVNVNTYKNFLKKVELKKEIELWGKKYYPADYGYMWNEELQ